VGGTTGLIICRSRSCWWAAPYWTICTSLNHPLAILVGEIIGRAASRCVG